NQGQQRSLNRGCRATRRNTWRSIDSSQVHDRGGRCRVQEHVVEGGIVSDSESAADHGLILTHELPKHAWSPSETHNRAEIVEVLRDMRDRSAAQRQGRVPEWTRSRLLSDSLVVQQVDGLLEPLPSQSEVEG